MESIYSQVSLTVIVIIDELSGIIDESVKCHDDVFVTAGTRNGSEPEAGHQLK